MHVDYPWDVALSRVVSVPAVLQRWCALLCPYTSCMGTSRVRSLPAGTGNMALKPPFSSLYYYYVVPRPKASTPVPWPLTVPPPPRSSLPVGIRGWPLLSIGMSYGAASSTVIPTRGYREVVPIECKRPLVQTQSTPEAGQRLRPDQMFPSSQGTPLKDPTKCGLWSTPEDGSVHFQ